MVLDWQFLRLLILTSPATVARHLRYSSRDQPTTRAEESTDILEEYSIGVGKSIIEEGGSACAQWRETQRERERAKSEEGPGGTSSTSSSLLLFCSPPPPLLFASLLLLLPILLILPSPRRALTQPISLVSILLALLVDLPVRPLSPVYPHVHIRLSVSLRTLLLLLQLFPARHNRQLVRIATA